MYTCMLQLAVKSTHGKKYDYHGFGQNLVCTVHVYIPPCTYCQGMNSWLVSDFLLSLLNVTSIRIIISGQKLHRLFRRKLMENKTSILVVVKVKLHQYL